jgi:hypothetical protein
MRKGIHGLGGVGGCNVVLTLTILVGWGKVSQNEYRGRRMQI